MRKKKTLAKKIFTSVIAFSVAYILGGLILGFITGFFVVLVPELGGFYYGVGLMISILAFIYLLALTVVNIIGWLNDKDYSGDIYDDLFGK